MPQLMLVNPARRRKARKTRRVGAKRVRRTRARKSNPVTVRSVKRHARRHLTRARRSNPIRRIRRRRNPISLRSLNSGAIGKILKTAAIGGVGALAMDIVMVQIGKFLPASLQPNLTGVGINDVVRVALTIVLGKTLAKSTKGMSETAAIGALTVQAANIMRPYAAQMMPNAGVAVAGLGYMVPNRVIPGNSRVSPIARGRMNAFSPGASPLLSMYDRAGSRSPLLSAFNPARNREKAVR